MSSISRTIRVLDLLARKGEMGVRAIAQDLKVPLGSTHRLLLDLAEEAVVERTPDGQWQLSYRLLEITGRQLERIELPRLARPFAEQIAHDTGETVNVNALNGHLGVCIDKVRGNSGMQLDMRIGAAGPLHCGGAGKAMLAYLSEAERQRIYEGALPALTPRTITDAKQLREEVERIRARGYSIDDQEVVMGVYCVSSPILDRFGRAVGAISVTGPSVKVPGAAIQPVVDMLWEATGSVSRHLGYAGAWPPVFEPVRLKSTA